MSYKVAIFDLDGTLLNTLGDLHAAVNHALNECRYPLRTIEEVRQFVGNGIHSLICKAVPYGTTDEDTEKCFQTFRSYYYSHLNVLTKPYDGILTCLQKLRENGVIIAIASNKFDAGVKKLSEHYFEGLVDIALGESPQNGKKPDPKMINIIMNKYGAIKDDTVYIGDSETDIFTAEKAGLQHIIVNWGFRSEEDLVNNGAKLIVRSSDELFKTIMK